jgi:chloramphenicol-sensitive protein RarD
LLAVSFIQFLAPTVQMLIAVTLLGEELTPDRLAAFVCIWLAVILFVSDALGQARAMRKMVNREPRATAAPYTAPLRVAAKP